LVTCPNCGHSVPSNQRFCGSCGADVHAAPAARGAPISENQSAPYAYAQPSGLGFDQSYAEPARANIRLLIIGAVLILALCCAFACGLLLGFELIPDLLGIGGNAAVPKPTPKFTPTPQSLLPIIQYFIG